MISIIYSVIFGILSGSIYGLLFYYSKKRSLFISKKSIVTESVRFIALACFLVFFLLQTPLDLIISMVFFLIGFWGVILKQERFFS